MEIPVLLITFGVAAILNKGDQLLAGDHLQRHRFHCGGAAAGAGDYGMPLSLQCDRFMEEHETMDAESAVKAALSKAIPEISASSLDHHFRYGGHDVHAVQAGL